MKSELCKTFFGAEVSPILERGTGLDLSRVIFSLGMSNPYIGKDGNDYHTIEALEAGNAAWTEAIFQYVRSKNVRSREG